MLFPLVLAIVVIAHGGVVDKRNREHRNGYEKDRAHGDNERDAYRQEQEPQPPRIPK